MRHTPSRMLAALRGKAWWPDHGQIECMGEFWRVNGWHRDGSRANCARSNRSTGAVMRTKLRRYVLYDVM